ncbi:MAG: YceI family protein [Candidatus Dormibacteria bacterium]
MAVERLDIDPTHSQVGFSLKHMVVATVRGAFKEFSGYAEITDGDLASAKGEVVIKTASIDTGAPDRDNHLRSADFFDAETNPEIRFVAGSTVAVGDDSYKVTGDLTMHGVTRPVELDITVDGRVNDPYGNERIAIVAHAEVKRKDWGLNWNQALEAGNVMVGEKVKLNIEAVLLRKIAASV